ncbi:MAG: chromosomal replication initiator protein DnaA [Solirubrobacterales bacterium]
MPDDALHDDLDSIWGRVTQDLRTALPGSTFELWLAPLRPVCADGSALRVSAPASVKAWVERRYAALLDRALRDHGGGLERIILVEEGAESRVAGSGVEMEAVRSLDLDPRHTFERFVIGPGNRMAHAAALAVAELPGEAYNPLFLHGPPGLGKTHLLGAIADYLRRRRPELTVHYTTTERFTTEFVTALRKDGPELFKRRYRKLDALLIDDVQALEGKEQTQEEFVHTFNALHSAGKQIVLSSDRPPEAITRLADRLRDRFEWGLRVAIGTPDLRTRTALLWRMTTEVPLEVTDPIVLRDIAGLAAGNVRRLEGAMTRIAALSSVLGEPVSRTLIRRALADPGEPASASSSSTHPEAPSITAIQEAVCSELGVSRSSMLSATRTAAVSKARQIAMYLARELTELSLADIAREFDRDHTTILHATRAVSARASADAAVSDTIHSVRELLGTEPPTRGDVSTSDSLRPQPSSTDETLQVKP